MALQLGMKLHELLPHPCWDWSCLVLCACNPSPCEYMCATAFLCQEILFPWKQSLSLALRTFLASSPMMISELSGRKCDRDVLFGAKLPTVSLFAHWSIVGFFIKLTERVSCAWDCPQTWMNWTSLLLLPASVLGLQERATTLCFM